MRIFNKRARFEYELTPEKVEAGIVLKGVEAKSFRDNRIDLSQSHVRVLNGEVFLINANIPAKGILKYEPTRMRKLLLHRSEILALVTKTKQKNLQIVPTMMYNRKRRIKLELTPVSTGSSFTKLQAKFDKHLSKDIKN
ncbi:MAG: SsrA-binding protein [Candidatus Woesebacteria bacterium GW2011_GWA2_33_28]|uniref:SsrA-binding protein n=1 Tax=Candidatus Woesebacteria bacterium GW2011_GWA2_33_28 TaxID=1618561 RepID=A0A0G0CV89_9BACT|nr:MAG: SsrA-binding protein [Candidatus Woesebacteria bacterium GW2011_GWA2_33_28]